jgi:phosphoribosylamine-glycine ligase
MRVLLIGKGAREHALAWKLSQSPLVEHIYVVPGNAGTARGLHNVSNVDNLPADNYGSMVELAKQLGIRLVVVGPDSAVVDGIERYFRQGASFSGPREFLADPKVAQHKFPASHQQRRRQKLKDLKSLPKIS